MFIKASKYDQEMPQSLQTNSCHRVSFNLLLYCALILVVSSPEPLAHGELL